MVLLLNRGTIGQLVVPEDLRTAYAESVLSRRKLLHIVRPSSNLGFHTSFTTHELVCVRSERHGHQPGRPCRPGIAKTCLDSSHSIGAACHYPLASDHAVCFQVRADQSGVHCSSLIRPEPTGFALLRCRFRGPVPVAWFELS